MFAGASGSFGGAGTGVAVANADFDGAAGPFKDGAVASARTEVIGIDEAQFLGDAMVGDGDLFTREDAVEAAWAVVEPILKIYPKVCPYKRGGWGPKDADALIASDGGWDNPTPRR